MASHPPRIACVLAAFCAVAAGIPTRIEAAPQQEIQPAAESVSRIKRELERRPAEKLRLDLQLPVATFRATVEQRRFMLSFDDWLQKEFELTLFQRQSQEWRLKCCGIDLVGLKHTLDWALQRRETRKIREQIARELAQLEADRK